MVAGLTRIRRRRRPAFPSPAGSCIHQASSLAAAAAAGPWAAGGWGVPCRSPYSGVGFSCYFTRWFI